MSLVAPRSRDISRLTPDQRARLVRRFTASTHGAATPQPLTPRPKGDGQLPLTHHQEHLWLREQLGSGQEVPLNISLTLRIRGVVEVPALRAAFDRLVERHEVFRTCIVASASGPVQVVDPGPGARLIVERQFALVGDAARAEAADRIANQESVHRFDLSAGNLLRGRLVTLGSDDHVLSLTIHHIVADGWSTDLVWRDLTEYYTAERDGREAALPALPVQFADYAHWQRTQSDDRTAQADLSYWEEHLRDLVPAGSDHRAPAPSAPHGEAGSNSFSTLIDAAAYNRLRELASSLRVTPFIVLGAAFACLGAHWADRDESVFGTIDHGRPDQELDDVVGSFAHPQILRVQLDGNPSFGEIVQRTRETVIAAREHSTVSLGQIVERLRPASTTRRNPFFDLAFQLQPRVAAPAAAFDGATIEAVVPLASGVPFDLLLTAQEVAEGLQLTAESMSDFCSHEESEALVDVFRSILDRVASDPQLDLTQLLGRSLHQHGLPPRRQPVSPAPQTPPALVPLRRGAQGSSRPALFLVPPISGSPLCYLGLSRLLPGDGPVLGIPAPGLDGEQAVMDRVEDLADYYSHMITRQQPNGPYLLAGWSAGGVIAYETARQLTAAGHHVALLAMIEPTPLCRLPNLIRSEAMSLFAEDLAHTAGRTPPAMDLVADPTLDQTEALLRLRSILTKAGLLPDQMPAEFLTNRFAVFRANLGAVTSYAPIPWPGRTVYLQGTESPDSADTWRDLGGADLELVGVPGNHYSMWSSEHLPALAHSLGAGLASAEKP